MTAVVRDQEVVAGAVLRVRAADEVVGGAFLVAPDLVATTAAVVAEALGTDPRAAEPPSGTVQLDFPLLHSGHDLPPRVSARVHEWSAAREGDAGTVLLRLVDAAPPAARMPPLRRVEPLACRSFSVLGFPEGLVDGVWSTGHLQDVPGGPHLRLDSAPGEHQVDAGFSGAPVWEASSGAVVGMAVHRPGADGAGLVPVHEVLGLDPEQLPCPYQGLRTFDEADAAGFFGRDHDIERLVDLVERQPVVAVAGPSGAGKSSLVRAGLVPRLRAAGAEIVYLRAEPGALDQVPAPDGDDRELVLVIDQFEDLAALDPAAARNLLAAVVRRTGPQAGQSTRAVLTLRWTTLDEMLAPDLIGTLDAGTVLVGPLDRDRLQDAIVRPAERPPGLAFEPGLVETILDDAGAEPGRLPLVESLLADLWERRDGGFLTLREYEAAGGVAGALAQHAELVAGSLPAGSDDAVRRLLTALARPDRDGRFVRRPVHLDELPATQRALVPALTTGRLLIVSGSGRGDVDVVELAHQALIDHWPRLSAWLSADRAFLAWREQVGIQREQWETEERADSVLLRGALLAGAAGWLPDREGDLRRADLDYLRRSTARQRREVRRWRIIAATLAVLALVAAALTAVSIRSGDQIATRLAAANADTLGREARARAAEDPATAAQLALAAWREDPSNPQARTALLGSYLAMRSVERELPGLTGAPITDLLLGGDTAVLVSDPHPVVVTGLSGPAPRHAELSGVRSDRQLALSRDGRWLAVQGPDRATVQVRDLAATSRPVTLPHLEGAEVGLARFSPDSSQLAWIEFHGAGGAALRIWDLRTGTEIPHGVPTLPPDVSGVHLMHDPERIIVRHGDARSVDSRLVLRSLTDGAELATFPTGALVVLGGAAVATCEAGASAPGPAAVLLVTPLDGSAPRRIGLRRECDPSSSGLNPDLSGNGNGLVEQVGGRTWKITDLRTGETFGVATPAGPPPVSLPAFDVLPTFGIMSGLHDRPVGVLARGTSLLWLRAEPAPADRTPDGWNVGFDDDIRVVRNRDGIRAEERESGRTLGELPGVDSTSASVSIMGGALWVGRVADDGWEVTRHELPTLRHTGAILLPSRDGGPPPEARDSRPALAVRLEPMADGGRLFAIADGVLSVWDPDSAHPPGPPIHLGATDQDADIHRSHPHMRMRPGRPGQVAVAGTDEVQIWDVPAGRLVTTIPAAAQLDVLRLGESPIAFDASGDRLAVLGRDRTVQLWDIASARPTRAPIPAPTTNGLVGFGSDGYLVTTQEGSFGLAANGLAFFDLATGAEAGTVDATDAIRSLRIVGLTEDRRTIRLDNLDDEWAFDMPATAPDWRDALCAAVGRELTAGEQRILPPGANADPPCS